MYATAVLCMGAALFIGLYAIGAEWGLDMPAMYLLHLVALVIGVVWAGYYYRLSGVGAWFGVAGGAGLAVLIVFMVARSLDVFLGMGALLLGAMAPYLIAFGLRRLSPKR